MSTKTDYPLTNRLIRYGEAIRRDMPDPGWGSKDLSRADFGRHSVCVIGSRRGSLTYSIVRRNFTDYVLAARFAAAEDDQGTEPVTMVMAASHAGPCPLQLPNVHRMTDAIDTRAPVLFDWSATAQVYLGLTSIGAPERHECGQLQADSASLVPLATNSATDDEDEIIGYPAAGPALAAEPIRVPAHTTRVLTDEQVAEELARLTRPAPDNISLKHPIDRTRVF